MMTSCMHYDRMRAFFYLVEWVFKCFHSATVFPVHNAQCTVTDLSSMTDSAMH